MRQTREPDWGALTAFLLSEQTGRQDAEVRAWLAESPDHAKLLDTLRSALAGGDRSAARDRTRMWAAIEAGAFTPAAAGASTLDGVSPVGPEGERDGGRSLARSSAAPWRRVAWLAAACIAVAGAATLVVVDHRPAATVASVPALPAREVITRPGRTAVVRLPDGSVVVLAGGSRLRYAAAFARTERDVDLEGEAFFTVRHASGWPFVVRAGGISARVLGTRFSVRKYAADSAARVIVAQGQVRVRSALLGAGDAITAWPDGSSTVTHHVDVGRALAWTANELEFRETPLSVVIPNLERAYRIRISVNDSTLFGEQVTASLEGEDPRDAMQIIAAITHSRAVWDSGRVTLERP